MSTERLALSLHTSAFPAAERVALQAAMTGRRLPGKLLYQSPAQAQRWLAYHAGWSPSRTDKALQALYESAAATAAESLAAGPVLLVGIGSGGGAKDAALLGRLNALQPGQHLHYAPLDASAPLVAEAALMAQDACPEVALHPLVLDLTSAPALEPWLDGLAPGAARVYSCFGMLPNQHPVDFPAWLAGLLRPGDALLVSANLSPGGMNADGPRILMQYDNPPARAWYVGALGELGLASTTYGLNITARPLSSAQGPELAPDAAWQVAVQAVLNRALELSVFGETLHLAVGERLAVFHSLRFTAAAAETVLQGAGLDVTQRWEGAAGEEGIFLCRRA